MNQKRQKCHQHILNKKNYQKFYSGILKTIFSRDDRKKHWQVLVPKKIP